MHNLADNWRSVPDWENQRIETSGFSVRRLFGLHQTLINGAIDLVPAKNPPVGWGPIAKGKNYTVRISRDRVLRISDKPEKQLFGWQEAGFATSDADDLYAVFEIEGAKCSEVFARGTTINWQGESNSAAMLFSKIHAFVYRHGSKDRLCIHVESPHATYFWTWLEQINLD